MKASYALILVALGFACIGDMAQAAQPQPGRAVLAAALKKYLGQHGDLCVGKFDWPIDVPESDFEIGTRDTMQMPAMEKSGLVTYTNAVVERKQDEAVQQVPVRRYELTEVGRKFYLKKEMASGGPGGKPLLHPGDFCAGKLSLDKVVGWNKPVLVGGRRETTVTFTYTIAATSWARDPELQKVFPMVARVVSGERDLQLQQRLRWSGKSWVAVPLWE